MTAVKVHRCPPRGSGLMPCCGRTPLELGRDDRITEDDVAVTCPGGVGTVHGRLLAIREWHTGVPRPSMRGRGTELRCQSCTSQLAPCPTWQAANAALEAIGG